MFRIFLLLVGIYCASFAQMQANTTACEKSLFISEQDSSRLGKLDQYWNALSKTVQEGDYEAYEALYHPDAVVVFATGKNKSSISIQQAVKDWKPGFLDTKSGKVSSNVQFRLSQRINDENTAHETGIFHYTSGDGKGGNSQSSYIHFEMLLVKKQDKWLGLMEYQKSVATKAEWDALK